MKGKRSVFFVIISCLMLHRVIALGQPLPVKMLCDFENDLCSWRHETQYTNGLKWHHSESNLVDCDGDDCSIQSDRYLYITSTDLKENGSFVRIAHYPLNAQVSGDCSLAMKYIANGVGFAKLIVGIRMIGYREPESILVVHTSKANDWYQVKVPLIASYVFTPVIEALKDSDSADLSNTEGFIAIDDVSLSEGCLTRPGVAGNNNESPLRSTPNLTLVSKFDQGEVFGDIEEPNIIRTTGKNDLRKNLRPSTQGSIKESKNDSKLEENNDYALPKPLKSLKCDDGAFCEKIPFNCTQKQNRCNFVKDCEDGSDEASCPSICNLNEVNDQEQFKQLCGWSQNRLGTRYGTWILISAIYASKYFENYPKTDATKGSRTGKYLILNVIKSNQIPSIHLNSPTFYASKNTCYFTFSYIIYDRTAVFYIILTVEPEKKNSTRRDTSVSLLWKSNILATRATKWRNASAYIGQQSDPFYLTFVRSSAPYSAQGTVALDNLNFNAC